MTTPQGFIDYGSLGNFSDIANQFVAQAGDNTGTTSDATTLILKQTQVNNDMSNSYWNNVASVDRQITLTIQITLDDQDADLNAFFYIQATDFSGVDQRHQVSTAYLSDRDVLVTPTYVRHEYTAATGYAGISLDLQVQANTSLMWSIWVANKTAGTIFGSIQATVTNFNVASTLIPHVFYNTNFGIPSELWVGYPPIEVPAVSSNSSGTVHFSTTGVGDGRFAVIDGKLRVITTTSGADIYAIVQDEDPIHGVEAGTFQSDLTTISLPTQSNPMRVRNNTDLTWVLENNDTGFIDVSEFQARTGLSDMSRVHTNYATCTISNRGSAPVQVFNST